MANQYRVKVQTIAVVFPLSLYSLLSMKASNKSIDFRCFTKRDINKLTAKGFRHLKTSECCSYCEGQFILSGNISTQTKKIKEKYSVNFLYKYILIKLHFKILNIQGTSFIMGYIIKCIEKIIIKRLFKKVKTLTSKNVCLYCRGKQKLSNFKIGIRNRQLMDYGH